MKKVLLGFLIILFLLAKVYAKENICKKPQYYDTRPYTITLEKQIELNEIEKQKAILLKKQKQQKKALKNKCKRVSKSVAKKYAHNQFDKYGWGDTDWEALVNLWNRESGWNNCATNGIYTGIPQTSYKKYGKDKWNYKTQINVGLKYIKNRYGNPTKAWAHFKKKNWY